MGAVLHSIDGHWSLELDREGNLGMMSMLLVPRMLNGIKGQVKPTFIY
jgi:hypothetical protein